MNNTVLVPTYREEYDTTALRMLRDYMPGYNVVGIDCDDAGRSIIQQSGAIHCITKAVGVDDPLWITHQSLKNTMSTDDREVVATIKHTSGISEATLYWSTSPGTGYQSVPMTDMGNDDWTADIPGHPGETWIYYYVDATANNGKQQVRPIVAPDGYWKYRVGAPVGVQDPEMPVAVTRVYPNPAGAITAVQVDAHALTEGTVKLYNMLGQEVETLHNGRFRQGINKYFFDAANLEGGIYSVVLETQDGRQVQKVVVK